MTTTNTTTMVEEPEVAAKPLATRATQDDRRYTYLLKEMSESPSPSLRFQLTEVQTQLKIPKHVAYLATLSMIDDNDDGTEDDGTVSNHTDVDDRTTRNGRMSHLPLFSSQQQSKFKDLQLQYYDLKRSNDNNDGSTDAEAFLLFDLSRNLCPNKEQLEVVKKDFVTLTDRLERLAQQSMEELLDGVVTEVDSRSQNSRRVGRNNSNNSNKKHNSHQKKMKTKKTRHQRKNKEPENTSSPGKITEEDVASENETHHLTEPVDDKDNNGSDRSDAESDHDELFLKTSCRRHNNTSNRRTNEIEPGSSTARNFLHVQDQNEGEKTFSTDDTTGQVEEPSWIEVNRRTTSSNSDPRKLGGANLPADPTTKEVSKNYRQPESFKDNQQIPVSSEKISKNKNESHSSHQGHHNDDRPLQPAAPSTITFGANDPGGDGCIDIDESSPQLHRQHEIESPSVVPLKENNKENVTASSAVLGHDSSSPQDLHKRHEENDQTTSAKRDSDNRLDSLLLVEENEAVIEKLKKQLEEERRLHKQELATIKQQHDDLVQGLQLRLYISETKLNTFQDALDDHCRAVGFDFVSNNNNNSSKT